MTGMTSMRGKWAEGIKPRHFTWVMKDQVAICEQPGGYGSEHREVRRSQEIRWIRRHGFVVASLCSSADNLSSYTEMGVPCRHVPFDGPDDGPESLGRVLMALRSHITAGDQLLVHREQCDERIMGLMAAYLHWTGLVPTGLQALTIAEQLFRRELGQTAREIMALVDKCPPPCAAAEPSKSTSSGSVAPDGA